MTLSKALLKQVRLLDRVLAKAGIEHVFMGGIATNVWSVPTPTYDLDLTVGLAAAALDLVVDLLEAAGYHPPLTRYADGVGAERFPKVTVGFEHEGRLYDVDVFFAEHDIQKSAVARRKLVEIDDDLVVPVMSVEDLLLHKLIAFRPKDRAAIERLLCLQPGIDMHYLDAWIARLDLGKRWQTVQQDRGGGP